MGESPLNHTSKVREVYFRVQNVWTGRAPHLRNSPTHLQRSLATVIFFLPRFHWLTVTEPRFFTGVTRCRQKAAEGQRFTVLENIKLHSTVAEQQQFTRVTRCRQKVIRTEVLTIYRHRAKTFVKNDTGYGRGGGVSPCSLPALSQSHA